MSSEALMSHPLNIPSLIVGGMLIVSGGFALIFTWNRRELVRGLSYKQFVWCCVIAIIGGALTALSPFIFGP
jgi:hypothetical protein